MVKEFVAASNDKKKAVFSKIEEEVEKLKGSTARYSSHCEILGYQRAYFLYYNIAYNVLSISNLVREV